MSEEGKLPISKLQTWMSAARFNSCTGFILAVGNHPIKLHNLVLYATKPPAHTGVVTVPSRHAGTALGTENQRG